MPTFRPALRPFLFVLLASAALALGGCHRGGSHAGPGVASNPASGTTPDGTPLEPIICIQSMDRRVPVIMYHDVIAERISTSVYFDTTRDEFDKQLQTIIAHNYTPISLDQLYDHLTTGAEIPVRSVVLTFDDNYRGFYENALPLLKKYNFPAAMFVHTNYVGDEKGLHPKMNWDQLKELSQGNLVTIGSHTMSHPADITKLSEDEQQKEIAESKKVLEDHLGVKVNYFAYPDGANDEVSQRLVKEAGYRLAVTTKSGLAEESPNLQAIQRYEHLKLDKALDAADAASVNAPAAVVEQDLTQTPVKLTVGEFEGLKIGLVKGGLPSTVLADSREGVADMTRTFGAAAGINGGFFEMASLTATSNVMIGPSFVSNKKEFVPDHDPSRLGKLANRPLVMWNGKKIAIFNFQPFAFNTEDPFKRLMPDYTDLFLAGAWIVHLGHPQTQEALNAYAAHDNDQTRRRAFFGWTASGEPVIGASLQTCSSERLGEAAAAAGVQEAVLLDSGFSTSLVFNGRIVVTGHTARNLPSRPVPHAIMIMGSLDLSGAEEMLASAEEGAKSPADIEGEHRAAERRAERRREAADRKRQEREAAQAARDQKLFEDPNRPPPGVAAPPSGGNNGLPVVGDGDKNGPPPPPPATTGGN